MGGGAVSGYLATWMIPHMTGKLDGSVDDFSHNWKTGLDGMDFLFV